MIAGPGHNNGPTMQKGAAWRKHCWRKARADLIPHLPIEILRGRVHRAKEIGLDYKTYASVRASTGHDVVGFLFSSNALRAFRSAAKIPDEHMQKLTNVTNCHRLPLIVAPLTISEFTAQNTHDVFDAVSLSPAAFAKWAESRETMLQVLRTQRLPADGVLLIGDTTHEREWSEAGRLAGYLPAERFFHSQTT